MSVGRGSPAAAGGPVVHAILKLLHRWVPGRPPSHDSP